MHELSLAMSILDVAAKEIEKYNTVRVQEIQLEVGALSGVDAEALEFALSFAVKNSFLEGASVKIIHTEGLGLCSRCNDSLSWLKSGHPARVVTYLPGRS